MSLVWHFLHKIYVPFVPDTAFLVKTQITMATRRRWLVLDEHNADSLRSCGDLILFTWGIAQNACEACASFTHFLNFSTDAFLFYETQHTAP